MKQINDLSLQIGLKRTLRILISKIESISPFVFGRFKKSYLVLPPNFNEEIEKNEILNWTWSDDINFEERWIRLGTKKNRTGEMVYEKLWMNDDLYALLMW